MKRVTIAVLAVILLFTCGYAALTLRDPDSGESPAVTIAETVTTEVTTVPEITTQVTTEMTTEVTTEVTTEAVTEATTEAVTEPLDAAPVETEPPVTMTTGTTAPPAPPPPPIDYTNLSGEYGFDADTDPNRTWAEMIRTGRQIDPAKPMIALTFDDGPGPYTERLLDIFAESGGKGTFFVVGYRISGREHILARMASEGHEIGGHSWWHSDLRTLTERAVADEIMMTRQRIFAAAGVDSRIARPPYGALSDHVKWISAQCGVAFVNWSVDTLDWKTRNADTVYNTVVTGAYDGAVILLHDIHASTVDAMERAIPKLIEDGYQLVTVSELMSYSDKPFESGRVYNRK